MKNSSITRGYESAKIHKHHYKPTLNIFKLLVLVVLGVLISGQGLAAHKARHRK